MDATQTAVALNERLSQEVVPLDELRAEAHGEFVALVGSRVARLPEVRRRIFTQQPESSDASFSAEFAPEEAIDAVDQLLGNWRG